MEIVRLKKGREKSLLHRHPWVYSGAVGAVDGNPSPGDVVAVVDADGGFRGIGYYNESSKIRVRVLSFDEGVTVDDDWWRGRVQAAIDARAPLEASADTTAYRLIHAEADGLPGLVVDRYGEVAVVQFLTAGIERARGAIVDALRERLPGCTLYDRSDVAARKREGLPAATGVLVGEITGAVSIRENGHTFEVDVAAGQKTGFYLDQRDNRRAVAGFASGRNVLDAFCYTGAFSAYAVAAGAASVTLVDSSAAALEAARVNLAANGAHASAAHWVRGDAFTVLREYRDEGRSFDMVILDPPKFASSRHQVQKALRAYKDVNLLAMRVLRPGGILATFSCSAGVGIEHFSLAVSWAGVDAGRDVRILRRLSQGIDHPVLASFPESEYLKGLICRVV